MQPQIAAPRPRKQVTQDHLDSQNKKIGIEYLLKTGALPVPVLQTCSREDNVGMMCRDCPARVKHNWVSVLFQLTAVVEGQLSKWASAVRVKVRRKEQGPPVLPQGVEERR